MTQKDEIRYLHNLLQHKDRWYVDVYAPDVALFQEIAERVKTKVDNYLSRVTLRDVWSAFVVWQRSPDKIMPPKADYYLSFLNDYAWDIGLKYLNGRDVDYYIESINVKVEFIP